MVFMVMPIKVKRLIQKNSKQCIHNDVYSVHLS